MDYPQNVIFKSLTGSHAYNLQTPESDHDFVGLFIAPTLEVAGLDWNQSRAVWSKTEPGKEDDEVLYEVSHLFRQILNGNPNSLEMISAHYKEIFMDHELVYWLEDEAISLFGVEQVRKNMSGFIFSIIKELQSKDGYNYKSVRTALIKSAGIKSWIQTGVYQFDSFWQDKTKFTEYLKNANKEDMIDLLESEIYYLENVKAAKCLNPGPNKGWITANLEEIRKKYI